jgi:hypothetical protein
VKYVFIGHGVRLQQSPCPVCGHRLDGLQPAQLDAPPDKPDDWTPNSGSFSICVYCGSMLRFVDAHDLRKATPDDLVELLNAEPEVFTLLHKMADVAKGLVRDRQRKQYRSN